MSWPVIARKDFEDAVRSKVFWAIVGFYTAMIALTVFVPTLLPDSNADVSMGLGAAAEFAGILVPITALVAAYLAIAGERESGSLKVMLGLPPSRLDVVLGKLVGRSGVVVAGVLVGFAVAGVVAVPVYGSLPVVTFVSVTLLTALLGLAYVAIAIGISAATATRARAMASAVGLYVLTVVLWDLVPYAVHFAVYGRPPGMQVPGWYFLLSNLTPSGAYSHLVSVVMNDGTTQLAARVAGDVPVYLEGWFTLGILLGWTVVPIALGYLHFRGVDLS